MLVVVDRKIPTEPGRYWWSEWKCNVDVYRKRGGRHLYVTPPGGVEVRVSHKIAGTFLRVNYPNASAVHPVI
jgi:hypothetical protein